MNHCVKPMTGTNLSILLVDDQVNVRAMYELGLSQVGYKVRSVADSLAAVEWLDTEMFDVALLDLSLPGPDGLMLAAQIQKSQPHCALVMISAAASRDHVVAALRMGIDDFLIKPVAIDELRRAVGQAALKHRNLHPPATFGKIVIGALEIDLDQRVVNWQTERIHLTQTEYCLLLMLAQRAGRLVSATDLMERCRGQAIDESEARMLIKPHIANLRRKLNHGNQDRPIVMNYRGMGFMLNVGSARAAVH